MVAGLVSDLDSYDALYRFCRLSIPGSKFCDAWVVGLGCFKWRITKGVWQFPYKIKSTNTQWTVLDSETRIASRDEHNIQSDNIYNQALQYLTVISTGCTATI